jgi:cytochrome c oxidase cbb3-type subunit 1
MWDWIKIATFGAIALFAAIAANWARDLAYQVHALIVMAVAAGLFVWTVRRTDEARAAGPRPTNTWTARSARARWPRWSGAS